MQIIFKKNCYIIKYKNRLLFKQYLLSNNKAFTYLYIIHVLCKLGFIKLN